MVQKWDEEFKGDNKKNCLLRNCYQLVAHPMFNLFIITLIVLNIVVLSLDSVHLTEEQEKTNEMLNTVFNLIFTVEMFLKLLGLGFKEYGRDGYNWLDATIVIAAILEMSLSGFKVVTALRGFRLLRVLKLARSWNAFRNLLRWLG